MEQQQNRTYRSIHSHTLQVGVFSTHDTNSGAHRPNPAFNGLSTDLLKLPLESLMGGNLGTGGVGNEQSGGSNGRLSCGMLRRFCILAGGDGTSNDEDSSKDGGGGGGRDGGGENGSLVLGVASVGSVWELNEVDADEKECACMLIGRQSLRA